ncbi:hypothetical protein CDHC01_1464 [Corynebacterium diphtheriae HC01]|nr:hypothetical protein CDHC01_1464 [Corynebacterium diphtheriae HC01]CAB0701480.1 hypothetical protein FRC0084_01470 [Corynebacterium diphtheriae]CAB0727265.1 hypothetical protein FRC0103_01373 [Corynebacterium diphtheriae]CAB0851389.1 hypothetical protein FRC0332_01511 [Corynebacterium diphtheriae]CAB0868386.1 hypothetical protein FRC0356_01553 [Corynebacterium diphtheriae]
MIGAKEGKALSVVAALLSGVGPLITPLGGCGSVW